MAVFSPAQIAEASVESLVAHASVAPVLTPGEGARLIEDAADSEEALAQVVDCHLRIAVDEAIRNRGLGASQERLVRVSAVALVDAARHFRPAEGVPFATFARSRIRRAIARALAT